MRSSKCSAVMLALAALAPGLQGCAEIAGLEDRQVIPLLVIAEHQAGPRGIALDKEAIYWTNERSDAPEGSPKGGALRKQIKDDWAVIDLLEPSVEAPEAIAVDATHIYWSSTDLQYIYNLSTKAAQTSGGAALAAGEYRVKVADPRFFTNPSADFFLKK